MAKKSRDGVGGKAGPAEEPPVPAVSWEELLARAKASLDERGLERQAKREAAAERIRARNERNGVELKFDGVTVLSVCRPAVPLSAGCFARFLRVDGRSRLASRIS